MSSPPGPRRPGEVVRFAAGFALRPHAALLRLYQDFGPVVAFGVGPTRVVTLFGPDANQFVFTHDEHFRWREAFEFLVPLDGETALIVSDGEDHQRRRRLVAPAFSRRSIDGYVKVMVANADRTIDSWRPGRSVDLYQQFRSAIRRATVQVLFGQQLAVDADRLGKQLQPILDFIDSNAITQQARRSLGTPRWRAAVAARAEVDTRIRGEIQRRRGTHADGDGDVLTRLISTVDEGDALSDVEIRDQVVSLIAAGYETTSAALAWACLSLLRDRDVWQQARREVIDVCEGRRPTAADLNELAYLDAVVAETLRLHPPAAVGARTVHRGFQFAGHDIPSGTLLLYSPLVTHRLPELWDEPSRFAPERWNRNQPGYHHPTPYEYAPFGGGRHRCLGAAFATVEMKAMLARLLVRADLTLIPRPVRPVSYIAMRPRHGVLTQVHSVTAAETTV